MKNLIIALSLAAFVGASAEAQNMCPAPKGQVCKRSGNGSSCYKTKYAEDFKVCKGDYGYFICCEQSKYSNSTHPRINYVVKSRGDNNTSNDEFYSMSSNGNTQSTQPAQNEAPAVAVAPESQSYPSYAMNSATSYEGYYGSNKHYIKVCYGGDNVAELNRAAYNGCPTPAYDGPQTNKARNANSNNTIDAIAPITGQIQ